MSKYEFKLTPAYCLYNGTAVIEQKGSSIKFLTERNTDEHLKKRLSRAFVNHVNYVIAQNDCPDDFRKMPVVEFMEGNRTQLKKFVSRLYDTGNANLSVQKQLADKETEDKNEAAAVVLLDSIMNEAKIKNATDIHIEENSVRFRINGQLKNELNLDEKKSLELIQRIKFLAGMNVLEKKRSQDGHFVYGTTNPVFVRVSSMGIIGKDYSEDKESIVIRLLDTQRVPLTLNNLGFNQKQVEKIFELCNQKNGMIIICGPTGAGKSTTAASMLIEIQKNNNRNVKIISLEDPPEYVIPGVTQIQIDEKIKCSFSDALIHVFRQDPDVLMIGEIRDEKSASAAIRASLTGHLVVATLHTASASGAILRLEDLGISRNVIVSVLKGVIVQEMNHSEDSMNLMADVSIPDSNLQSKFKEDLSEIEMNYCFNHFKNFIDLDENPGDLRSGSDRQIRPLYKNETISEKQLEG